MKLQYTLLPQRVGFELLGGIEIVKHVRTIREIHQPHRKARIPGIHTPRFTRQELQQLIPEVMESDVFLFNNRIVTKWQNVSIGRQPSFTKFRGENPPQGAFVHFWLKTTPENEVEIIIEDLLGQYKSQMSVTGKPGINQVNWNMRFPVPEANILKFKERLLGVLNKLGGMVKTEAEKEDIRKLVENVRAEDSERPLSFIHRQLARNYSAYSRDSDLFGASLQQSEAMAGEYKITLIVDGRTYLGRLKIRNDPLMDL